MLAALNDLPNRSCKVAVLSGIESQWPDEKNRLVFLVGDDGSA
jgi:hypothetical protein